MAKTALGKKYEKLKNKNGEGKMKNLDKKYNYEGIVEIIDDLKDESKFEYTAKHYDTIKDSNTIKEADDRCFLEDLFGEKISKECYQFIIDGKDQGINFDLMDIKSGNNKTKDATERKSDEKKIRNLIHSKRAFDRMKDKDHDNER